jgi:lauroyl/myristoyl acyltransferase
MNTAIEKIVRRDPAQYQWSYKRFRRLGGDQADLYRRQ